MSRFESENRINARQERLSMFDEKKNYWLANDSTNVYIDKKNNWEYVTHYPMADKEWWFEKHKQSKNVCWQVDLYWKFDGDVAFVEIGTKKIKGIQLFARWNSGMLYLMANVQEKIIYSATVKFALKQFWNIHKESNLFQKYYQKSELHELNLNR